jgi:hypothetical protein
MCKFHIFVPIYVTIFKKTPYIMLHRYVSVVEVRANSTEFHLLT